MNAISFFVAAGMAFALLGYALVSMAGWLVVTVVGIVAMLVFIGTATIDGVD